MDTDIQRYDSDLCQVASGTEVIKPFLYRTRWPCGPCVSATTTQLSHCGVKAATDDTSSNDCGCVSIQLYLQEQVEAGLGLWAVW